MIKGLYSSSSGMPSMLVRLEVIANNLSNINTNGFKRDGLFVQLMKQSGRAPSSGTGELGGIRADRITDFSEGSLKQTGNPLDLAVQGRGFFVVETPQGLQFTRNGSFMLTLDGTIVTAQGHPVLGEDGKLQLPDIQKIAYGDVVVSQTGEISVDKNIIGKLRIVDFETMTNLVKGGESLFGVAKGETAGETTVEIPVIRQGYVEESNVDGIHEMIMMIELTRNFESNQKAIQSQDGTLEKAAEIARL